MSVATEKTCLGVLFGATLALTWTVMTVAVIGAAWAERDRSAVRLAEWGSLWLFTVLVPTLNARAIHRSLSSPGVAADDPCYRDLARVRPLILLTANMALLSAFALILGR